jgi:hypothetical protein
VRGACLAALARVHETSLRPGEAEAAAACYERLLREHPDHPEAARAKGRLFRLRRLQPGQVLPDLEAADAGGKPIRLSDFKGRVLFLEFWGFW